MEQITGHGEKLGRRREMAIAALLQSPTVSEAAVVIGVAETTLQRWLLTPNFSEQYDAARRQVLDGAIIEMQALTGAAVAKLRELLNCGNRHVEIRAAITILDHGYRAREICEHEERIVELERLASEQSEAEEELRQERRVAACV